MPGGEVALRAIKPESSQEAAIDSSEKFSSVSEDVNSPQANSNCNIQMKSNIVRLGCTSIIVTRICFTRVTWPHDNYPELVAPLVAFYRQSLPVHSRDLFRHWRTSCSARTTLVYVPSDLEYPEPG
mgnify:CR=1 FL=1